MLDPRDLHRGFAMTTRDPDKTRHDLLEAAFWEIWEVGFRAASLDRILKSTGVTKGALYYHFKNKTELGYAVVDECIAVWIREQWVKPLGTEGNAVDIIKGTIRTAAQSAIHDKLIAKGCPLNNLAQEMSPIDEGFRSRLEGLFAQWMSAFTRVLERGQEEGTVRGDINAEHTAQFVVAALEGVASLVKNNPNVEFAMGHLDTLFLFLDSLRTAPAQAA
jgi:TetR/AcrR family transcriptional repressor of nem operon